MLIEMLWATFSAMCSMNDSSSSIMKRESISNPSIVSTGDMVGPLLEAVLV